ncbi:MAG: hypothetical protein ABSD31_05960 [Candidatus Binataceae bacterium]|jgi:hypothetical protein
MKIAILLSLALLPIALAACQKLPEPESPAAKLYVEKCGTCHAAYNPRSLTAAMWSVQMKSMDIKIRGSGQPPLTEEQYKTLLDYLTRYAQ